MFSSMFFRSSLVGLVVGSMTAVTAATGIIVSTPEPAEAAAAEPVTVKAKNYDPDYLNSPMPDLEVTFSQTTNLTSQGINISWRGAATPSEKPGGLEGGSNFLQIFQCWGDDPTNPSRPDRETCQYGSSLGYASTRDGSVEQSKVAPEDAKYTVPKIGLTIPAYTSIPFRAVSGEVISSTEPGVGGVPRRTDVDVNTNQFFTKFTSNELNWIGSGNDGTNSIPFEIQTMLEAPGLGCGKPQFEGTVVISSQSCWLVVLPRGTKENGDNIIRSGLFWESWENHLAVRLDFKPVGVRCQIGSAERQIAGSELMSQAIASWQPRLCLEDNGAAFVVNTGSDQDAVYKASLTTPSPLAMTSRAYETDDLDANVYAPISVSGAAIVFNVDRRASSASDVPENIKESDGVPFTQMNLTPRLVAKLLTNSYVFSLPAGDRSHLGFINFDYPGGNPYNLTRDPDFWQINDEHWKYQSLNSPAVADALVPTGRSDIAWAIWSYIFADADARAFLNGEPDPWGMVVNPWYSTNPSLNPTGSGKTYPRDDFPKADPVKRESTLQGTAPNVTGEGELNLVAYRPYTSDFDRGAYYTLRGDGLVIGGWQPDSIPPRWGKASRDFIGSRKVIGISTVGSAAKYTTVTAALRNSAGNFVAPTAESMSAAVSAMTPSKNSAVVEFDHNSSQAKSATNAYPLTMPVYAAMNPLMSDATLRATYASFIRYAVQDGQVPGSDLGNLPQGYAPIPATWVTQAMNSASAIQAGIKPKAPVNVGSIPAVPYVPVSTSTALNEVIQGSGDIAILTAGSTVADPDLGALSGIVPLSLLTGLASAFAVPVFTRARRRVAA
jgi:hypothetical protein